MSPASHFHLLAYQTHICCHCSVLYKDANQWNSSTTNLISRNIESKSITLWWSRRKMLARGVCSYVNQSPYFATIDGPPLALKISGKYLTTEKHKLCNTASQRAHYRSSLYSIECQNLVCSLSALHCCDWMTGRGSDQWNLAPEISHKCPGICLGEVTDCGAHKKIDQSHKNWKYYSYLTKRCKSSICYKFQLQKKDYLLHSCTLHRNKYLPWMKISAIVAKLINLKNCVLLK